MSKERRTTPKFPLQMREKTRRKEAIHVSKKRKKVPGAIIHLHEEKRAEEAKGGGKQTQTYQVPAIPRGWEAHCLWGEKGEKGPGIQLKRQVSVDHPSGEVSWWSPADRKGKKDEGRGPQSDRLDDSEETGRKKEDEC